MKAMRENMFRTATVDPGMTKPALRPENMKLSTAQKSQYMKCISRVMLEMDGLVYCINYHGVYPNWDKYGAEGLGQMAAEIIRAGE